MNVHFLLSAILLFFGTAANSQMAQWVNEPESEKRIYTKVIYNAPVKSLAPNRLSQSFWKIEADAGGVALPSIVSYNIESIGGLNMNSGEGVVTAPTQCDCIVSVIQISPFEAVIEFIKSKSFFEQRLKRSVVGDYLFPLLDDPHKSEFAYQTFDRASNINNDRFQIVRPPRDQSTDNIQNFEYHLEDHTELSHAESVCGIVNKYVNNQNQKLEMANSISARGPLEKGSDSNSLKFLFRDLFLNGMFSEAEHILDSFDLGEANEAALRPILGLAYGRQVDRLQKGKLTCNSFYSLLLTMNSASNGWANDDRTTLRIVKSFNELSFGLRLSLSQQLSRLLMGKSEMTPSFASAIADADSTISSLAHFQDSSVDVDLLAAMSVAVRETYWDCDTSFPLLEAFLSKRRYFDALRHITLDTCQDEENEANRQDLFLNSLKQNVDTLTLLEISDDLVDAYPSLSGDIISLIDERGFRSRALELQNRSKLIHNISSVGFDNSKNFAASVDSQTTNIIDHSPNVRFDLKGIDIEEHTPSNELSLDGDVSNQPKTKISVQDAQNWILTSQETRSDVLDSLAPP